MDESVLRVVDANLNRLGEGLRVLEEVSRFILNDISLSERLKTSRHNLAMRDQASRVKAISSRDSESDVGQKVTTAFQNAEKTLFDVVSANVRRAEEALRVLEEAAPLLGLNSSLYQAERFNLYTIEKDLIGKITRQDKMKQLTGRCASIDLDLIKKDDVLSFSHKLISKGCRVLFLRCYKGAKKQFLSTAKSICKLCQSTNSLLLIEDNADIVLASKAYGILLTEEDLSVSQARSILPIDAIIGCSVMTDTALRKAIQSGADFIAYKISDTIKPSSNSEKQASYTILMRTTSIDKELLSKDTLSLSDMVFASEPAAVIMDSSELIREASSA